MYTLQDLITKVFLGNSILIVGAGFSHSAKNINNENLPVADGLTNKLYGKLGIESDGNLSNAVEEYIERESEHSLIELLKKEFSISEVQEEHLIVTSLPWKRIYTTNYDNLLEMAKLKNHKLATPVTINDKPHHYQDKSQLCIHLNGYIDRLTPASLQKEFKLRDVSYLTTEFVQSEWVALFRNDIKTSDSIFYVGFSLSYDLDLKRIIFDQPETHEKTAFILYEKERDAVLRNTGKFGANYAIGLKTFAQEIKMIKENYVQPDTSQIIYDSFKKIALFDNLEELRDTDTIQLFFEGNIKQEFVQLSISNPETYKYFIKRDKLADIINEIKKGVKNFLIHSDLGNGKTIFLHGLAYLLKAHGYNVFMFYKEYENLENELEHICKSELSPVIIIESYSNHLNLLESLKLYKTTDVIIILSERTIINDTIYSKLEEEIFNNQYLTYDLNYLSDSEIEHLVTLFDTYGFWGTNSNLSHIRKVKLINEKCRRTLRLLLLEILNSPDIRKRFDSILATMRNRGNFYDAIIIILASNIFDFQLDLDDLVYILDDELLNNPSFRNNASLKEMIDFKTLKINVRSSVLSEVILSNLQEKKIIIDCLIKVVTKLDRRRSDRNSYNTQKNIVSFSRLQRVIDQKTPDYKSNIVYFFERIKNLESNRRNPYFWLQYAIARLSIRDYNNAELYFKTSYSYADSKDNFDTYQIDNHYARFLLENEIYYGGQETCMEQFLKAHKILYNSNDENTGRHYPIRVAKKYIPFYRHFFSGMEPSDKIIFLTSCKEILFRIDDYFRTVDKNKAYREVVDCQNGLKEILEENKFIKK